MGLRRLTGILLAKWYLAIPGILLSLAMAGVTFSIVSPLYTSSGMAVLTHPKQTGLRTSNSLLSFDSSLGTIAQITIASLNSSDTGPRVSGARGSTFSVKNSGPETTGLLGAQPFLFFSTQSSSANESSAMVYRLMDIARQNLIDQQVALNVRSRNFVNMQIVVEPTTPKYVVSGQVAAGGAAFLGGVAVSFGLILLWELLFESRARPVADPDEAFSPERLTAWEVQQMPVNGSRESRLRIRRQISG
jgi:capsular polysaccharide biosynthesis protein